MFARALRRRDISELTRGGNSPAKRIRKKPALEQLEARDLPAPLTWFAAPSLAAARTGAVALAAQGSAFTVLGGGATDVPYVIPADPAWQALSGSDVPLTPPPGTLPFTISRPASI
jgi:hypothetical protein